MTGTWQTHPHAAEGYLFILPPTVVFAARINLASASYPTAEIPFDGVTTGAYSNVKVGMTVLIGSAAGLDDRGRIYARAKFSGAVATADTLYIGYAARGRRPGEVDLQDNSYLTVLDLYEPWVRRARMADDGTIYKDYERVIDANPPPVAQIGGAGGLVAAMDFIDPDTGVLAVDNFDASGSYLTAPSGSLNAPIWDMGDGSYAVGSSSSEAPDVTFPPGWRWISLGRSDNNGQTALPRRALVIALDGEDDAALIQRVSGAHWRLTMEGVSFDAKLRQRLDPALYVRGTVLVWMVKEFRAGAASNLTGWQVKFAGWINSVGGSGAAAREGWQRVSTVSAEDAAQRHHRLRSFASTMAREDTPLNANQMAAATLDRYAWWYLYWHTFWPSFSDVQWSGDTTPFTSFSSPGGDFYTVVDQLERGAGRRLTMDSRGRTLMPADPLRQELSDRTATVMQAIGPGDISKIERMARTLPATGVVRATFALASTVNASAVPADTSSDIYIKAPGDIEGSGTGDDQVGYPQLASSIDEAQLRTGQDYARANALEDHLRITLAHGGDAGIEAALGQWVTVTTDDETVGWLDTPLSSARALVLAVDYQYDDAANAMTCALEVELESDGTQGVNDPVAGSDTPVVTQPSLRRGLRSLGMISDDGHTYYCGPSLSGVGWDVAAADGGPLWIREPYALDGYGVTDYEFDAFCPAGLGTGPEVRFWIATGQTIYRVTHAEDPALITFTQCLNMDDSPFVFAQLSIPRVLSSERGTANRLLCVSNGGNAGTTWVTSSVDGVHWATEVNIDTDGTASSHYPGAFVSRRSDLMLASTHADLHRSTTAAPSFGAAIAGLTFVTGGATTGYHTPIHVPFDQADDDEALIGGVDGTTAKTYRISLLGGTKTDITPVVDGASYGPHFADSIQTSPNNHRIGVLVGWDVLGIGGVGGKYAIFRTLDGSTWTVMVAPTSYDGLHEYAHVQVTDNDTSFHYGLGVIGLCDDLSGAATIDDRRGNIPVDFPDIGHIVGLWGVG